jgi:PAS domain S-box-containing protein
MIPSPERTRLVVSPSREYTEPEAVDERELADALDAVVWTSLRPMAVGLSVLYVVFAAAYVFWLPEHAVASMAAVAATTAALFATLYLVLRRMAAIYRRTVELEDPKRIIAFQAALLDAVEQAVIATDLEGRVVFWNRFAESLYGWSAEEVMGRDIIDITPALEAREHASEILAALTSGQSWSGEFELRRKDGTTFTAQVVDSPIFDGSGNLIGVAGLSTDITERKAAEEALRASEERYRLLADQATDMISVHTPEGKYLYASPASRRLLGYEPEELIGRSAYDFFHPADLAAIQVSHSTIIEMPVVYTVAYRIRRKDGEYVWFETTSRTVRDPDTGEVEQITAISRDITERKAAEDALRHSEERFRALAHAAYEAVVIHEQGEVLEVNPAFTRLSGYAPEEIVGRSIFDLLTPVSRRNMEENAARDGEDTIEVQLIRKDGTLVDLEGAARSMPYQARTVRVVALHDVTEQKRIEDELRRARAAAEAATEAKSEFLANMSHEIRTPLNAIIGTTGLLLDIGLTPEQQEFAESARRSSDALLVIINDILDFSKIEAGKLELETRPFDLRQCIESALDLVARRASAKGLETEIFIDEAVPSVVVGDVTRLRQVLTNLLDNAVKFTRAGGITVRVTSQHPNSDCHNLHFSVRDTGVGIPADRMDRLFQSFSQVDASTTRQHGGTGLGLAICRNLVEMMGGRIWVESQPANGSTFHFTMSVEAADEQLLPKTTSTLRFDAELGRRHPLRILVAEDDALNQQVLRRMLERLGYRPDLAGNGQEVLVALERQPYDLVFMDIQMPEMDGLQATARIRENGRADRQPHIIALTAYAGPEDRNRFLEVGVDGYISKPVTPEELVSALARARPGLSSPTGTAIERETGAPRAAALAVKNGPIDSAVFAELEATVGDASPEVVDDLIDLFLDSAPELLADMRAAFTQGDPEALHRAAHTLKSSSATLGAVRLAALCEDLAQMGCEETSKGTGPKLAQAEAEYARVEAALQVQRARV